MRSPPAIQKNKPKSCMKSEIRWSKCSGSTKRKIEAWIAYGWAPWNRVAPPKKGRQMPVAWSSAIADFNAPVQMRAAHDEKMG